MTQNFILSSLSHLSMVESQVLNQTAISREDFNLSLFYLKVKQETNEYQLENVCFDLTIGTKTKFIDSTTFSRLLLKYSVDSDFIRLRIKM